MYIFYLCRFTFEVEYGGLGLNFSYSMAVAEELGSIRCGGIPMAIGVQTDMATPALARFGSDKLKRNFLAPSIRGDLVACLGVSEIGGGSDVASMFHCLAFYACVCWLSWPMNYCRHPNTSQGSR